MSYTPTCLATVALLKTRLDEGHDHLGLFEPLVRDALAKVKEDEFDVAEIQSVIQDRTGILLPADTLKTLLGRFARRHTLQRIDGRFRIEARPTVDANIDILKENVRSQQQALGQAFLLYATKAGLALETADAALEMLATVASENKVHLILEEPLPDSPLDRSSLPRKTARIAARFIAQECLDSPSLRPALQSLVEGIVLYDALFHRDGTDPLQRFQRLTVALDTGILFSALGLTGVQNGVAAREGLSLLREAGACTVAFDHTLDEMRRILNVYEDRLATPTGVLSLHPTDLTRHVLANRYTPADIRIISATLEVRLTKVGVHAIPLPDHVPRFTLDEKLLAEMFTRIGKDATDSPRVRHDVDAIAAVLTLRKGKVATAIERSVAIFCTTTGKVVHNAQEWYSTQGQTAIPPVIHQAALTSIAWLKKPTAAPGIKLHELVALCASAMRPTRATWTKLTDNLRRLRDDGVIGDDETAAIVASELTEPLLARLDDDSEPDAASILGAIDRVRETYRREASAQADEVVRSAQAQVRQTQQAAGDAIRSAHSEAALAREAEGHAVAGQDALLDVLDQQLQRSARFWAGVVFWILASITLAAAIITISGMFGVVWTAWKTVAAVVLAVAALLTAASRIFGGSLVAWRVRLASFLHRGARLRLLSNPAIPADWCDPSPRGTSVGPS